MILIEERKSKKIPAVTSLFLKLNYYNPLVLDILKQSDNSIYDRKTDEFEFSINKLYFLVDLLTKYDDVKFITCPDDTQSLLDCNNFKFKVKPYSYQLDGINYGLNHLNWLLLDDQGLGKTLQMIYLAEVLKKREGLKHCLIICGINSLKYNWAKEISKFSNLTYTILGQKITKTGKIKFASVAERCKMLKNGLSEFFVITNKETLQNKEFVEAFNSSRSKFDMIVLDEAHKCKNPSSKSTKSLLKLKANRKIALTGTIIMNNPENAYVSLKWTNNIGSNYSQFKNMFNEYGGFGGVQVIGYKNLDILKDLISKCSLRRLKSEVLDLPEKTYQIEYVEMGSTQQALYDEVEKGIAAELDLLPNKDITILQELAINMRLRQITAYPGMLSTEVTCSAKLDRLEELAETIIAQGDKLVVFCTFKGTVKEIANRLSIYNPVICTGDNDDFTINKNKNKFEEDSSCKVMICTWQKMGTGHTLTSANYAIFVDTPWTDSDFQQCADRIYRIGQNKHVFIITLITKNTYDERVQEILERKECLSGYLIDDKDPNILNIFE
jgi:SNF2 family DNA or RNA helicase